MIKGKFSQIVVVCLFLVGAVAAKGALKVNESKTSATLNAYQLAVNFAVENDWQKNYLPRQIHPVKDLSV